MVGEFTFYPFVVVPLENPAGALGSDHKTGEEEEAFKEKWGGGTGSVMRRWAID